MPGAEGSGRPDGPGSSEPPRAEPTSQELGGRVALVTGAGTGIGAAVAARLSRLGAAVVLVGRRPEPLEDVAKRIGDDSLVAPADVTDPDAVAEAITAATDRFGHLDIVVNNAGTTRTGLAHRASDDDWDTVVGTNLTGAYKVMRAAFRPLRDAARDHERRSKVVNVGSTLGIYGGAMTANYSAAKAGLIGLTKSLAREWGSSHINVNLVASGFVGGTELSGEDNGEGVGLPKELLAMLPSYIPVGRVGTPDDIANVVAFLAGPGSDYVTGAVLEAHGGLDMLALPLGKPAG
jgi:3-oxoacyl-[acyl-carrier protein] reductase